jgi:polar amino acid transport system substrate-binding protein
MLRSKFFVAILMISVGLTFLICPYANAQGHLEEILKRGVLKVGIGTSVPGFCQRTPAGKIEGMDADLAKFLAEVLFDDETKVELIPVTGAGRIPAVVTRKVDVVICDMTITPRRAIKGAFTIPYIESGQLVLLRKDVKAEKLEDLNKDGTKIAIYNAPFYINIVKKHFPKAERLLFESPGECLLAVRSRRAHAMVHEMGPAKNIAKADNSLMIFETLVSSPQNVGMLVNKNDIQWLYFLNTCIQELRTGFNIDKYREMHIKWFGKEPSFR